VFVVCKDDTAPVAPLVVFQNLINVSIFSRKD